MEKRIATYVTKHVRLMMIKRYPVPACQKKRTCRYHISDCIFRVESDIYVDLDELDQVKDSIRCLEEVKWAVVGTGFIFIPDSNEFRNVHKRKFMSSRNSFT